MLPIPAPRPAVTPVQARVADTDRAGSSPSADARLADRVRAAAGGDRDAFAGLYRDYVRLVHSVLLGRVARTDVDDLVQDVFITAFTRLPSLREPAAFAGWIATIARNRATDHLRQARDQVELPPDLPGGASTPTEAFAALDAVRSLPEAYRDTLMLRLVHGMSGQEIADRTGLTPASVRVNLHRGMKLLREKLRP